MGLAARILDSEKHLEQRDPSGMLKKVESLPDQAEEARRRAVSVVLPRIGSSIRRIVVSGMGGSAIAGDVLRGLFWRKMSLDMTVVRHYRLPAFVGPQTLVIASSYSGDTEETLSAFQEACRKGCRILAVTSGGKLTALCRRLRFPCFLVPGGLPPRSAFGYSFFTLMAIFERLHVLPDQERDFRETVAVLRKTASRFGGETSFHRNDAKRLAAGLFKRFPVVYGGVDTLEGVVLRWRGQFNENAEEPLLSHVLPEMNHNEIVAFTTPTPWSRKAAVVLLRSADDHPRVKRRFSFLRRACLRAGARVFEPKSLGRSALARALSLVHLGDFVSVYLALLKRVDPTPVTLIGELKKDLAR